MAYCTNCGKETTAKKVCEHCGVKHQKNHCFCSWCGSPLDPNGKVCPNCKEPKKIGSFIGKIFRVLLAIIILFIGMLYTIVSLISAPDTLLPGIIILLVGIVTLPFSQKLLHKWTHNKLQLRKIIKWLAPPLLVIIFFLAMDSCTTISGYNTAMRHWDDTAYAAAMNYLTKNPEYKDSQTYIDKFESDVTASLMQYPWWAGLNQYGDFGDSIHYAFSDGDTVLRRTTKWDMKRGMDVDTYEDFRMSYTLIYDVDDETGLYEVLIRIGPEHDYTDYVVHLGVSESGVIVVNGFHNKASSIHNPEYFSRDTRLPE